MRTENKWEELEFDLAGFCTRAGKVFPIDAVHLFGSRRHETGSVRSDIDVFFETSQHIKFYYLRSLIDENCKALDIFVLDRGKATSVVNESFVYGENNKDVLCKCGAINLWSRGSGLEQNSTIPWKVLYASHVDFAQTILPNAYIKMSIEDLRRKLHMRVHRQPAATENA